jgi:S-ribosylhomocysteine lyase LuxS involved in autoinducer biosynthesis
VAAENAEKMKVQAFKTIEDLSAQLQRQKRQVSTSSLGLESDHYLKSSDTELQRNVEKDLAQVLEHKQ